MVIEGGSWRMEVSKCHSCFQEGGLEELQVGQPYLSPWEGDEENPAEKNFQTHEGQEGDSE